MITAAPLTTPSDLGEGGQVEEDHRTHDRHGADG
jgi:hypothetical protein